LILLFVIVSRVILDGVLAWYSYIFWLILTPWQLLFSLRIHNLDPAILMSTLWIIMISHKSDSHGLTSLGSILWCKWNCGMLIIYLLSKDMIDMKNTGYTLPLHSTHYYGALNNGIYLNTTKNDYAHSMTQQSEESLDITRNKRKNNI